MSKARQYPRMTKKGLRAKAKEAAKSIVEILREYEDFMCPQQYIELRAEIDKEIILLLAENRNQK